jgi:hypothetical protein
MALVVSKVDVDKEVRKPGEKIRGTMSIAWDNSYPTGGEPITPAMMNAVVDSSKLVVTKIKGIWDQGGVVGAAIESVRFDNVNEKLLAYAAGAQVVNATDLSAFTEMVLGFEAV